MPKLTGFFSGFPELGKLTVEDVNHWLKAKEQVFFVENFIGNRYLYPQTIPLSADDLEVDFALLREFIRYHPEFVYSAKNKKLQILEELELRFPPPQKLIGAVLDVLALVDQTPVLLRKTSGEVRLVGTVVSFTPSEGESFSDVNVNGQLLKLQSGTVTILPNREDHIVVQINSQPPLSISGGQLGVVIDLRKAGQ